MPGLQGHPSLPAVQPEAAGPARPSCPRVRSDPQCRAAASRTRRPGQGCPAVVSLADACPEAAGWRVVDTLAPRRGLWTWGQSWARRADEQQRKILESPSPGVGGGRGGVHRPGLAGSGNGCYKCANVCSFPSASLSPTAVLCMLLSVNRWACGGASVRWLVTSHFSLDPFFPHHNKSTSSAVDQSLPHGPQECVLPGEGRGLEVALSRLT